MGKSTYLCNKVLDHCMGRASYTMPSNVYAALLTVAPSKTSTGATITEANYTGYARVKVNAADLGAASGASMTNSADIEWPDVQGGSSTVVAVAFLDASSSGNMLYFDSDVGSVQVSTTQTPPVIRSGSLTLTED